MDPVTLIMNALTAGASVIGKDLATEAVKDSYAKLKALLEKCLAGKSEMKTVVDQYEKKPDVWKSPMADLLAETGAGKSIVILEEAERLIELVTTIEKNRLDHESRVAIASNGSVSSIGDHSINIAGSVGGDISIEK